MRIHACILLAFLGVSFGAVAEDADILHGLNSEVVEYGAIRTPFGIYLTEQTGQWGKGGASRIIRVDADGRRAVAEFSAADADDSDPFYDPKSGRLCFVSTRADVARADDRRDGDIWCVARTAQGWGTPVRLPSPVNSPGEEYSPVFDDSGVLYFASDRPDGFGAGDLYTAEMNASGAWRLTNMGGQVNSEHGEWNIGVRPDGGAIIFESSSRPTNLSVPGDLYYAARKSSEDGGWTAPVALSRLNTRGSDLMARWFDADTIVFARSSDGDVDHVAASLSEVLPLPPTLTAISRSRGEAVLLDPISLEARRRIPLGAGPHEIASSEDGRIAISPLLGIYPTPHEEPIEKRPPFLSEPSGGVVVLDLVSGETQTVALDNCPRPHGAAIDAQGRRAWITCESVGDIIELDIASDVSSNSIARRMAFGKGVHKVIHNRNANALIATNPDRSELQVADLSTGEVRTIALSSGLEAVAVSSDGADAYVAGAGGGAAFRVSLDDLSTTWRSEVSGVPIALTYLESRGEVWVSRLSAAKISVLSAATGELLGEIALPSGALNLAANSVDGLVYASLPRRNEVVAISMGSREITAVQSDVMEGDDLDLTPAVAFGPQSDS